MSESDQIHTTKPCISRKVIMVGYYAVGKTSLVNRFAHNRFSPDYQATLGVRISKKQIELDYATVKLYLWDLADITTFDQIPPAYLLGTHGIIFVYDLSREQSCDVLLNEIEHCRKALPNAEYIIAGNKLDLMEERSYYREVVLGGHHLHYYTSAKTGENVQNVFEHLATNVTPKIAI